MLNPNPGGRMKEDPYRSGSESVVQYKCSFRDVTDENWSEVVKLFEEEYLSSQAPSLVKILYKILATLSISFSKPFVTRPIKDIFQTRV